MKPPTQCALWKTPQLINDQSFFQGLETFSEEDHWRLFLLKCRECGQLYIYNFYEEIDFSGGEDTLEVSYIPVETDEEIETLKHAGVPEIHWVFPRLVKDSGNVAWLMKP
jgi:hypothetical protein